MNRRFNPRRRMAMTHAHMEKGRPAPHFPLLAPAPISARKGGGRFTTPSPAS